MILDVELTGLWSDDGLSLPFCILVDGGIVIERRVDFCFGKSPIVYSLCAYVEFEVDT